MSKQNNGGVGTDPEAQSVENEIDYKLVLRKVLSVLAGTEAQWDQGSPSKMIDINLELAELTIRQLRCINCRPRHGNPGFELKDRPTSRHLSGQPRP